MTEEQKDKTSIDLDYLAYTMHLFLHRLSITNDAQDRTRQTFHGVMKERGYPDEFSNLLSLIDHWTNDIGWWVEDHFGIKCDTGNINTWKINEKEFESFSMEYFEHLHELVTKEYERRKDD